MRFSTSLAYLSAGALLSCLFSVAAFAVDPSEKFDLKFGKLQVPMDDNNDGKFDEIDVRYLGKYSHPDFTFRTADPSQTVEYEIDLSNNIDAIC